MKTLTNPYQNLSQSQRLERLGETLKTLWVQELKRSTFAQHVLSHPVSSDLYVRYMLETFHYTSHNARNQALVGVRAQGVSPQYTKFCFDHAQEETGHELMALHDVQSMGVKIQAREIPAPLPETEVLVSYLYWISAFGNPLQRLGYSFWAEGVYVFIGPQLKKIKSDLQLKDSQMTFFVAHSSIDEDHAKEVERMLLEHCKSEADWSEAEKVMRMSLRLTIDVADAVLREHLAG